MALEFNRHSRGRRLTPAEKKDAQARKKQLQAVDGAKAMAEYVADGFAVREKIERLRALRLARDAPGSNAIAVPERRDPPAT